MADPESTSSSPAPTERLKATSGTHRGTKRSRASTDPGKEEKKNKKHKDNASSPILKDDSEWGNSLNEVGSMADTEDNDEGYDSDTICADVDNDHGFNVPKTHLSNIRKAGPNTRNVTHNFATMSSTSFSGTTTSTSSTSPTKKQRACPDKAQKEVKDAAKAAEDAEAAAEAQFIADCKEITRRAAAINEDSETETTATTDSTSNGNGDTQVYTAAVDTEGGKNQAKEVKAGNKVKASQIVDNNVESSSGSTGASGPKDNSASQSGREGSVSNINLVFRPRT